MNVLSGDLSRAFAFLFVLADMSLLMVGFLSPCFSLRSACAEVTVCFVQTPVPYPTKKSNRARAISFVVTTTELVQRKLIVAESLRVEDFLQP